jgi:hypothetical protein
MEFKFAKNTARSGLTQNETGSASWQVVFDQAPFLWQGTLNLLKPFLIFPLG